MGKTEEMTALLAPLVDDLGLELLGIEYQANPKHSLLRVYIDRPQGEVVIADCEQVSREISALLDVRDPIHGHYNLEVSSPGLDRPLFTLAQFERFIGEQAAITVAVPIDGRRRFKGTILSVAEDGVRIMQDDSEVELAHANIVKARLVPRY